MALLAPAGLGLASLLRIRGRAPFFVAFLLACASIVVAETIVLSLVDLLTRAGVLVAQALALALVAAAWSRAGRPRPPAPDGLRPRVWLAQLPARPALSVLVAVAAAALLLQLVMALAVAPNEADSVGYHLARVVHWLGHHSAIWPSSELDDPEVSYPPNGELLVSWTVLLCQGDRLAQLVQWLSLLGLAATIFSVARLSGFGAANAAWASLLFVLMPEPLMQAATVQNDIVTCLFLVSAGFFLVRGLRDRHRGDLGAGALGLGLAIGTKLVIAFALPGLALVIAAALRAYRPPRGLLVRAAAMAMAAALALGSFSFIQNLANTGTLTASTGSPPSGFGFTRTDPLTDGARVAWTMVDAEGLPVPRALQRLADRTAGHLFARVDDAPSPLIRDEADEDTSAYGLVGLLVLFPLMIIELLRPGAPPRRRLVAAAALGFCAAFVLIAGWHSEAGRYLMPAAAAGAALLALTATRRWLAWVTLALALATVPGALLENPDKPVLPDGSGRTIFARDRIDQQTIDPELQPLGPALHRLGHLVPPPRPIGYLDQLDAFPQYLLFTDGDLHRRVVAFDRRDITADGIRHAGVAGVFVALSGRRGCPLRMCPRPSAALSVSRIGPRSYLVTPRRRAP
ncbi:MAG: DUF2029 domain-containing protein [Actinobacteria bacterium]|nr:MAG: DUF2029 domain-containing protein [Actinomycetota bacterium]